MMSAEPVPSEAGGDTEDAGAAGDGSDAGGAGAELRGVHDFRTELELWPASSVWVREKYKMEDEAAFQEVVRHWEGQIAASPQVRADAEAIRVRCWEYARTKGWVGSGGG